MKAAKFQAILIGMTALSTELRQELLSLPEADREELAQVLFESLSPRDDQAFEELLLRREKEIMEGTVVGVPEEEFFARLDARLAKRK